MILAGDIGGTSTRLALFESGSGKLKLSRTQTYSSREFPSLTGIVTAFFSGQPAAAANIQSACFGIAGPVRKGHVSGPNLAWEADESILATELGIPKVKLINDLEANAWGIAELAPEDVITIQAGDTNATGNMAVISVGTGLGEAGMFWDGTRHIPFACEGGHADFAPRSELECDLLNWLRERFGRVSYERILSGNGQFLLYEFLRDVKGHHELPAVVEEMKTRNPSAVITRAGLAGESELCVEALNWYASLYGAEAGNLALKMMATGGVYIGGGIAPKIIQKLKGPSFAEGFSAKGRLRPLLEAIPIHVIMKESAALWGAARVANLAL
jgi:glucokinase